MKCVTLLVHVIPELVILTVTLLTDWPAPCSQREVEDERHGMSGAT